MLFFGLVLAIFFVTIFCYNKKYSSPYKLICLFGKKGSGKTTTEAKYMLQYAKRGYQIYTDIDGVTMPGVHLMSLKDLKDHWPKPKSCILLDEVGLSMSNRDFKNFDKGLREFFKLQRHASCVVIINSQGFDMDKSVRLLCDQFYFVSRLGPLCIRRPLRQVQKPNDMMSPNNDSPVLETYAWGGLWDWKITWIPKYAHMFNSFALPDRPWLPENKVDGELPSTPKAARAWLRAINRAVRKRRRR